MLNLFYLFTVYSHNNYSSFEEEEAGWKKKIRHFFPFSGKLWSRKASLASCLMTSNYSVVGKNAVIKRSQHEAEANYVVEQREIRLHFE